MRCGSMSVSSAGNSMTCSTDWVSPLVVRPWKTPAARLDFPGNRLTNETALWSTGRRMKICYYNHTGKVSGAEKVLFTVLANVGPGFDISLISPGTEPIRAFCLKHQIRHLPVAELEA